MKAQKLSQFVVSDLRQWMEVNYDNMSVRPKDTTSTREKKVFWIYHHKFPLEFVNAIQEKLDGYKLVSYDHLNNKLECTPIE
jgi:hypothetical protein